MVSALISAVPEAVWGALTGSGLTLLGVWLTARSLVSQQRERNEFERVLKKDELKANLRHSTYLHAAQEMMRAQQHLMNLAEIDFAKQNPSAALTGFFSSISQVMLVAEDATNEKLIALLSKYEESFYLLLEAAMPIQDARIDRDISNSMYERYSAEAQRILAEMAQYNEEVRTDRGQWDALQRSLEFNNAEAARYAEQRDRGYQRLFESQVAFSNEAFEEAQQVSVALISAMAALRDELGISTDVNQLQERLEQRYRETGERMRRLFQRIKEQNVA